MYILFALNRLQFLRKPLFLLRECLPIHDKVNQVEQRTDIVWIKSPGKLVHLECAIHVSRIILHDAEVIDDQ